MKCNAIRLCVPSICPHTKCPLSQHGSSHAEVILEDVSAPQNNALAGSAACSDAESVVSHGVHHKK
eukprot:10087925-Alexandrium_andersonii.AAC.1